MTPYERKSTHINKETGHKDQRQEEAKKNKERERRYAVCCAGTEKNKNDGSEGKKKDVKRGGWMEGEGYTVEGGNGEKRQGENAEVKGQSHFSSITAQGHILGHGCVFVCV